ncbi:MAG: (Fe-S)-binding protein [Thermoplasmata archaeon]|nr:(Fe-S)-binding protein [Thermoplasmata archaeon]
MPQAKKIETKSTWDLEKEMMTCTYCGFCKSVCPVFDVSNWEGVGPRGKVILAYGLREKEIPADESVLERIYQCTTCKNCERRCPSDIKVVDIVESIRKDLVANDFMYASHRAVVDKLLQTGNPYGETKKVTYRHQDKKKAKVGYFVGCTARYRFPSITNSTISILEKLGEDFLVLDEVCCGSTIQRIGWPDDAVKKLLEKNIKHIEEKGVEKVVFTCAGCYKMFKKVYPKYTKLNFEVKHMTEELAENLPKLKPLRKKITYHDPCHLGRYCGIYDEPRKILKSIPEAEFAEMEQNKATAMCCGGGGGLRSAFPEYAKEIAARRVAQAESLKADMLLTSCPFCVTNLSSGKDKKGAKIDIKDLVEVVDQLI